MQQSTKLVTEREEQLPLFDKPGFSERHWKNSFHNWSTTFFEACSLSFGTESMILRHFGQSLSLPDTD